MYFRLFFSYLLDMLETIIYNVDILFEKMCLQESRIKIYRFDSENIDLKAVNEISMTR